MRALVTGGTGFIGSHIAQALASAGHEVRILHRKNSKLTALQGLVYESALGDILDVEALEAACKDCDWVFHAAAVADYWRASQNSMFEANVEGTRRVLAAGDKAEVKRVVFTSSAAAVGILPDGKLADESVPFNMSPRHFPYGYSKVLAERVIGEAAARGQEVVIVNPVMVMGPGDLNMISGSFIIQTKQFGMFTPISSGGSCVVDVRDVARWHLQAAESGISGERYILGTANYSYADWFGMIANTVGVRHPFIRVPNFILPMAASVIDLARRLGIDTPIDATQARLGGKKVYFDYSKTWTAFGKPQIDMRDSLTDTYNWYRQHGYL